MKRNLYAAMSILAAFAMTGCQGTAAGRPEIAAGRTDNPDTVAVEKLLAYIRDQNSTGFLVIKDGVTLMSRTWSLAPDPLFDLFRYEVNGEGELLEDVASQQKSFVAILVGIAVDKGMVEVGAPVSQYIGTGWSKASPEEEAQIQVGHLLAMNSGLDDKLEYVAPPGTLFFYNTPAYAVSKQVLTAASGLSLQAMTAAWLTGPLAMEDTQWRERPAGFGDVGNNGGLVTSPGDSGRFGEMILARGVAPDGRRIISETELQKMFAPSATNPAYGRLWWLNGSDHVVRAGAERRDGPLIAAAPPDLVAALGFLDRRLYVVPSLDLVVVRTGTKVTDENFDEQLWQQLLAILE
ncbi:serine hydrolase domain-containing protein [Parasphingorhabdus sp.]|uniref:serine hydrolase domain-containing protein n=1 Tax=Parasphingorhabdus sp. TaxID=2709688 RepID=UPI0030037676